MAAGSAIPPLVFGTVLGLVVEVDAGEGSTGRRVLFALFLGTALSVTAFPVLARVLDDRGERRSVLGTQALATAGFVDLTAWIGITALVAAGSTHSRRPLVTASVLSQLHNPLPQ